MQDIQGIIPPHITSTSNPINKRTVTLGVSSPLIQMQVQGTQSDQNVHRQVPQIILPNPPVQGTPDMPHSLDAPERRGQEHIHGKRPAFQSVPSTHVTTGGPSTSQHAQTTVPYEEHCYVVEQLKQAERRLALAQRTNQQSAETVVSLHEGMP